MAAWMIVNLTFHSLEWAQDYLANVPTMVREHGGEYLARSQVVERIEGQGCVPDQVVILSFPSLEAIRSFMASQEYTPYRDARVSGTTTEILAIEF